MPREVEFNRVSIGLSIMKQLSKHEPVLIIYCRTESDTQAILARCRAGDLVNQQKIGRKKLKMGTRLAHISKCMDTDFQYAGYLLIDLPWNPSQFYHRLQQQ